MWEYLSLESHPGDLEQLLDQYGKDRWELVSVIPYRTEFNISGGSTATTMVYAYLKRQKI